MAQTMIQVWRIAIYKSDGESLGDLIGYRSDDGDITEEESKTMWFNSREEAGAEIDNSDELELGMREVPESVMFDVIDFMTLK